MIEIQIFDSVLVKELDYFINGQMDVKMVGDSIIAVSSIKSPAVSFFKVSGEQRKWIASGDYPIGSFQPSNFDASQYPIIYLLDMKSESILIFDVEKQEFLRKIRINFPENMQVKFVGSKFLKLESGYMIELASSLFDNLDPNYYNKSEQLIYLFDNEGKVQPKSFLEYPKVFKELKGSLKPLNYLQFATTDNSMLFTFPHDRTIKRFEKENFGKLIEEIPLPQSKYFKYQLLSADQIISFQDIFNSGEGSTTKIPSNHYFNKIIEKGNKIFITTWMNNNEDYPNNLTYSNLLVYHKDKNKWYETSNPRNILDIGMLAGVINDTLYFYEGSLMKHDEKYIKRAVLKQIED
ncbi:hypothetical protein [Algoriphagus litoralis]|uniref:hypothetical protein n=1 Tax=Algoriphagus litoralis TaxID=2202829 RepID=UPI00130079DA|nr:hypothetical protein [Algoriphagus litoralis]